MINRLRLEKMQKPATISCQVRQITASNPLRETGSPRGGPKGVRNLPSIKKAMISILLASMPILQLFSASYRSSAKRQFTAIPRVVATFIW
jgi:hypothetical protein